MKFNFSKEWCLQAAQTEAGIAVAACNPNIFKENKMKTAFIRHYESKEDFDRYCTKKDLMESDLVSYSFEGDYVYVVKSRFFGNFMTLNIPRYLELVACTLKHKSYEVEEKKSINDFVRNIWNSRLKKLEVELFPAGYVDCSGLKAFDIPERLSRIEKKLGVVQSPGDDLGRLENCEGMLKITYWRLNRLDREIYPTQKDVDGMSATITLDGWMEKLERKLGVNLAFTDIDHRLKHIEDAWACTKMSMDKSLNSFDTHLIKELCKQKEPTYVCGCLKHQQALQDALQEKFGEKKEWIKSPNGGYNIHKIYIPKYKVGDVLDFNYEWGKETRKILEVGTCPYRPESTALWYLIEEYAGVYKMCEEVDNDKSIYKVTPKKTYVPKYHIGDTLEFHNESCVYKVTRKIIGVGLLIKTDPNTPYYNLDREDGQYIPCEQVDKNTSIRKVTPKEQFVPDFDC